MIGQALLHYKVLSLLGKGGMGEVYLAEDSKLGRKVALKVLPPEMAADPERRARFEREAKAVAALNHPNIVTLHSVEEDGGVHFITMELVEGRTLTEVIGGSGLPLAKLLEMAIPLADALAAAHQQGILHRDLKPDNFMVGDDGRVKILDFGLAKLREEATADTATQLPTQSVTADGRILGTVAYMSPEQAEGKQVDHRSDIFSLGIVLYEMATGKRPFRGETTMSTLTSIMRDDPRPITEVKPDLPRHLGRIVRRCLAKETGRRTQTALDVRNELEELRDEIASGVHDAAPAAVPAAASRTPWMIAAAATLLLLAAILWSALGRGTGRGADPLLERVDATMSPLTDLGNATEPDLSPDGRMLVYVAYEDGVGDIYLQRVGGEKPINLTEEHRGDDHSPAFSPDGERIAFVSDREGGGIFVMGATGESPSRVTDRGFHPRWSPDGGTLVYTTERLTNPYNRWTRAELWTTDLGSSETRKIADGDAVEGRFSPDGSRIAFWSVEGGRRDIFTIPAGGGERVAVTDDAHTDWGPIWSPDGRYLYFLSDRGGSPDLWRVRVNETSGRALAPPQAVTAGVARVMQASISGDGNRIAYTSRSTAAALLKIPFDPINLRAGEPQLILESGNPLDDFSLSPDGALVAYTTTAPQEDLYVIGSDGSGRRQLTNDAHRDRGADFSPDGKSLAMYSNRSGRYDFWLVRPDGTDLRSVTGHLSIKLHDPIWSPDARMMAGSVTPPGGRFITVILDLEAEGGAAAIDPEIPGFYCLSWSGDGKWLSGTQVNETHERPVAIHSLETGETRVVTDPDGSPYLGASYWLADSRRLLFSDLRSRRVLVWDRETDVVQEVEGLEFWEREGFFISRDDRMLLAQKLTVRSDIWMLELER